MSVWITTGDFNENLARAKRATANGPVFITHLGKPAYVLMKIKDYERLRGASKTLYQAVAQSEDGTLISRHEHTFL